MFVLVVVTFLTATTTKYHEILYHDLYNIQYTIYNIRIRVMKTKLMHYLSSVYFASQPLHVSDIFVAHHQMVYCIYTAIGRCCAFSLTVYWSGWNGTYLGFLNTAVWSF